MGIKEVDFMALAKKMWRQKKSLMKYLFVGGVVGVVVALSSPKSYTASVLLAPELSSGSGGLSGGLADIASQFGVSFGGKDNDIDAIYPAIYPDILSSVDFVYTLFDVPIVTTDNPEPRPYITHIRKEGKSAFWDYPKIWLRKLMKKLKGQKTVGEGGEQLKYIISQEDFMLCEAIGNNISCLMDNNTSEIAISFTDQDGLTAAIMADTIQRRLQHYITEYRTSKARTDFEYYKALTEKADQDYKEAQRAYAAFCDSHQNISVVSFSTQRDNLEQEMQMAYNLLTQTKAQMVSAEAKIQERTPAFTIISEAKMPYRPSSMPRSLMVLIWMFLAGVVFTVRLFFKEF